MKQSYKKHILLLTLLFATRGLVQGQLYFPVAGKSIDDFSSSYGPRNLSPSLENYPGSSYDYDFHAGIDIGAPEGTNIYPVADGVFVSKGTSHIIIKHTDNEGDYLVKYSHLNPSSFEDDAPVTGGQTVLGTLKDLPTGPNLDIRYYRGTTIESLDANALNPGRILGVIESSGNTDPIIVDKDGNDYSGQNWGGINDDIDNGTAHGNPAGKKYFEFGLRVLDDELDLDNIAIWLTGYDGSTWYFLADLLDHTSDPTYPGEVDYEDIDGNRKNCGDQSQEDDDIGHNSSSVGIYPRAFAKIHPHHTVYFRWYVNESIWNNLTEVYLDVTAQDWYSNTVWAYSIPIEMCTGCEPSEDAPNQPTLVSISNDPQTGVNHLEWTPDYNGEPADFYKIYRCPSTRGITDGDVVGITGQIFYDDNDIDLVPGIEYRYAVSGVNEAGEGYNSNELLIVHQNEPPSTPVLSLSGLWGQNPILSWTHGGEADLDHFVLKKKYVNNDGTLILYVDPATSPYTDPLTTINPKFGDTRAEYWVKGVDRAGQSSSWSNKKSTTGDGPHWKQSVTADIPERYSLGSNYPNPFNPTTTIRYALPQLSFVEVSIFDMLGRKITTLLKANMEAGYQSTVWDGKDSHGNPVSSGMYFYRLDATSVESDQEFHDMQKMILLR